MTIDTVASTEELLVRIEEGHIIFGLHDVVESEQDSKFYPVLKDHQGYYRVKKNKFLTVNKMSFTIDGQLIEANKYDLRIQHDRRYGNVTITCTGDYTLYYDFNLNIVYKIPLMDIEKVRLSFLKHRGCVPAQTIGTLNETAYELTCFVANVNSSDIDRYKVKAELRR
jgi:hypothetical protein|nr:MAG TPA: hypothetical protein [Caudoviricetes sp.]